MAISRTAWLLGTPNRHPLAMTWSGCVLAAMPAGILGWDALHGLLGANPLDRLLRTPGRWALILLLVVLTATPLRHTLVFGARHGGIRFGRRLADWNWLIRLRRPLGLASFFYALAHAALYLSLDAGFSGPELTSDLRDKPFILAGLGAFLLLLPLALTSTDASMRRLKRNWKRLHFLAYPAAILALLHFAWLSKPGTGDYYAYALVLGLLLGYRIAARGLRVRESVDALGDEVDREAGLPKKE